MEEAVKSGLGNLLYYLTEVPRSLRMGAIRRPIENRSQILEYRRWLQSIRWSQD